MNLPSEIISTVVDYLWNDIVVHVDTMSFLRLLRVNKIFHFVVRRRRHLMWTHAVQCNVGTRFQTANPLSNPFVDPGALLCGMCPGLGGGIGPSITEYRRAGIARLVLDNRKRFDTVMLRDTSDYPVMFESNDQGMSGAAGHMLALEHVPLSSYTTRSSKLLQNVTLCDIPNQSLGEFPYAVMIAEKIEGTTTYTIHAFRTGNDGTLEFKVVIFDTFSGHFIRDNEDEDM
ncbi:hypothetical protein DFJ77DRAFT_480320 [Powellomyces hirtus]|nr:hypothetical protein DFJ77DRAFT_480320 [Powellomyces hirtus]